MSSTLLSVYCRVRPTTASKEALEQEPDAIHNTVEIIPMGENESGEKDHIITSIRTNPPPQSKTSKSNRGQNHLYASSSASSGSNNQKAVECAVKGVEEYQFSQVFGPESSQEELYKSIAVPLVEGLFPKPNAIFSAGDRITGHSALLFSYGITNAGKTFTMMGGGSKVRSSSDKANAKVQKFHGIIPRTIDRILEKIDELNSQSKTNGVRYSLNMSHLEIYNNDIYDLLPQKKTSAGSNKYGRNLGNFDTENKKLQLRDLRNGNIHVEGLTKHRVSTLLQGLELSQAAKEKRHTSSNNIHDDSSRSHSICQFELNATRDVYGSNEVDGSKEEHSSIATDEASGYSDGIMSSFWVVDLAGSERSKRTGAFSRVRQNEANHINSSLMNLMTCLRTLKQNQSSKSSRSMVPFRDSKLTHLLMGHLTGISTSRTRMIVNVNPSATDFDETLRVLKYAADARSIRIEVSKKRKQNQMDDVEDVRFDRAEVVSYDKKYLEATDRIATLEKENKSLQVKTIDNDALKKIVVKVQEELAEVKISFDNLESNYEEAVMQVKQLHETKSTSEQQILELKSMLKARDDSILNLHGRLETFNEDLTKAEGEIEVRLAVTNDEESDVVDELDFGDENDESYDESEGQLSGSDDEEKQHDSMAEDNDDEDSDDEDCNSHSEDDTSAKNQGQTQKHYEKWNNKLEELHEYKRNFGDCLVPLKFPSNRGLGRWVNHQRIQYKYFQNEQRTDITSERIRLLERVGFVWSANTYRWKLKLQELELFFKMKGHTNVPERGNNKALAQWITRQRSCYKKYLNKEKTTMDAEKVLLLRKAGLQLE